MTEEELREYCETNFGEIKKLNFVKDEHGKSKGMAFIEFINDVRKILIKL